MDFFRIRSLEKLFTVFLAFAVATSATGSAFDETPISAGFRGISQSSIKLPSHQSPPPTEEPFFTLKVEVPPPPMPGSEKGNTK